MSSPFVADAPIIPIRGVHLDLKGCPPTATRLRALLRVFAAARYNAVLVEWEDTFPWTVDARFRSETAYTPEDVRAFCQEAAELGIELIPLVQCLGHMETPLSVNGYEPLREVPANSDVLNPLAAGAADLVRRMVEDVLTLMPGVKRLHLGGDEAWTFGTHPDTKAYIQRHGKGTLYLHHITPILQMLATRGVRPILWHDMMCDWESQTLRQLAQQADLMVWGYGGHPDTTSGHFHRRYIERFREAGIRLWGATAYKGADGHNIDLPDLKNRQDNALAWAEVARRYSMAGVVATAWSRYSTHRVQNEPIDAALDSLINVGVVLHDGRPPEGGIDACVAALEPIGERTRFEQCKEAMRKLTEIRRWGWQLAQHLREQIVTATADARRRGSGAERGLLAQLRQQLTAADAVAQQARAAFEGLMPTIWIDRYLAERIEPLREELGTLEPRVRQLDPSGPY